MLALLLGLTSALSWAVHDFLVRRLAQTGAVLPLMLVVVASGCLVLAVPTLIWGGWDRMTAQAYVLSIAAGVAYVFGMLGLYSAFRLAPVRVVAPVLGAFPMITLAFVAAQGRAVSLTEGLAVLAIVAGIALVAVMSSDDTAPVRLVPALTWAALGALGFATTFGFGQAAVRVGAEFPTILIARLVALAGVGALAAFTRAPMRQVSGSLKTLALMGLLDTFALALVQVAATLPNPEYAAVTSALFGVLTILLAWRFLGEKVAPLQWLGIAVVFAGIALLSAQN